MEEIVNTGTLPRFILGQSDAFGQAYLSSAEQPGMLQIPHPLVLVGCSATFRLPGKHNVTVVLHTF